MPRNRGDREVTETLSNLFRLGQILSFLVVFVAGVVIGLTMGTHINGRFSSNTKLYTVVNDEAKGKNSTIVQICNVDCNDIETFVHPKSLSHSLQDGDLFWRASLMPKKADYPFKRVSKIAFMFLTKGSMPFLPLWERFFEGHQDLFSTCMHLQETTFLFPIHRAFIGGRYRVRMFQDVSWGTSSLTDAERRLLANALLDFSNDRFVLLSESCIPVFNFPIAYKYITQSDQSFVESYDDPSRYGRGRYSRNMLPDIYLNQWRKGSQWFEMSRYLAVHIVSDTKYYELFQKYCKPACYPDEHYIPTYLHMFHGSQNANRSLTRVDWSMGGPHPATFGKDNITEAFIRFIRNSGSLCTYNTELNSVCYMFARKFDPSALEPLLDLISTLFEIQQI